MALAIAQTGSSTATMKDLPLSILILAVASMVINAENDSFGSCPLGKTNCSKCYLALKKSLLGKDDNIHNLSLAFFPPQGSAPEFVTVTYNFDSVSTQTWFWTQDSSYLFFPLRTFQYLSLFFGKLERDVSQRVTLTLDVECTATEHRNMVLLTQRVSCLYYDMTV